MRTRRSLLRTGALASLGVVGAIAVAPSPPNATPLDRTVDATESPDAVAEWTDKPITGEAETPIVRYQYRKADGDVNRTDFDDFVATAPINVVFVPDDDIESDGLERVMSILTDEGWLRAPEEYTRYGWDRDEERFVRQQATAADAYYGTSGRLHVRCWSFEGIVSMQAHEDTGARPKHGIASYERGRTAMEAIYADAGWDVSPTEIDLDNDQRDHDGQATVITEAT